MMFSIRAKGYAGLVKPALLRAVGVAVAVAMSRPASAQVTRIDMYIGGYLCGN
jgi:hypothetical protein